MHYRLSVHVRSIESLCMYLYTYNMRMCLYIMYMLYVCMYVGMCVCVCMYVYNVYIHNLAQVDHHLMLS